MQSDLGGLGFRSWNMEFEKNEKNLNDRFAILILLNPPRSECIRVTPNSHEPSPHFLLYG